MKRSVLWAVSAGVVGLAVAALRCNSVLGSSPLTSEACTENCGPCTAYCNAIMQSCPQTGSAVDPLLGPLTEYLSTDICLRTCSVNSTATSAPSTPNWFQLASQDQTTFACRQALAGDAGSSGTCTNAGPLGGTTCVSPTAPFADPCRTFCMLDLQICTGVMNQQYDSEGDCEQFCNAHPGWYVTDGGTNSDLYLHKGDDTLNCRFYHLENAMVISPPEYSFGPDIHCIHTGKAGGGVCIAPTPDAAVE